MCKANCSGANAKCSAPCSKVVRRIKARPSQGAISGQAITDRMVVICGCKGAFDCACVTVENRARRELWSEHNQRQREAAGGRLAAIQSV